MPRHQFTVLVAEQYCHPFALHSFFLDEGRRLITADSISEVIEWDTGELPDKLNPVRPVNLQGGSWLGDWLSPNRRFLALTRKQQIEVWDFQRNRSRPSFQLAQQEGNIHTLTFSPDSQRLITASAGVAGTQSTAVQGDFVRVWDLTSSDVAESSVLLPTPERFMMTQLGRLTVTPDNRFLIASSSNQVIAWTLQLDELYAMAVSATGREMTDDERKLYQVPPRNGAPPAIQLTPRHPMLREGALNNPGMIAAVPVPDPVPDPVPIPVPVPVPVPARSSAELVVFREHRQNVLKTAISPDGRHVASAAGPSAHRLLLNKESQTYEWSDYSASQVADNRVLVWELESGKLVRTFESPTRILGICWSTDGSLVRWTNRGRQTAEGNVQTGAVVPLPDVPVGEVVIDLLPSSHLVTARAANVLPRDPESGADLLVIRKLNSGAKVVALAEKDWSISLLNRKLPLGYPRGVEGRDGRLLFTQVGEFWNSRTQERVSIAAGLRSKYIDSKTPLPAWLMGMGINCTLSPDGSFAAMVLTSGAYTFQFHDQTVKQISLPKNMFRCSLAISPDGKRLAFHHDDQDAITLHSLSDDQVLAEFRGHKGSIHGLAFTPDGQRLVSAGADKTVRVWQLPSAGK